MINFLCEGEATANPGNYFIYVVLIVLLIAMLVLPFISQRRKNKEYEAMINSISVGDLVKTAGGIIGRIKSISDKGEIKTVILETGSKTDKSYMEFDMNMIFCVLKSSKPTETASNAEDDDEDDEEEIETQESQETGKTEEVSEAQNTSAETSKPEQVEEKKEPSKTETKKPSTKSTTRKSSVSNSKKNKK